PDEERRIRLSRGDKDGDDEDVDSLDELSPRVRDVAGLQTTDVKGLETRGTKTTMADVTVRDERSKLNLNGVPAEAISNLLGCTITTGELKYAETNTLLIEDWRPFYSDGDPTTMDGTVVVNGEEIGYCDVQANPPALKGLSRGLNYSRRPPPEDGDLSKLDYPPGMLVNDQRGRKIAFDAICRFASVPGRESELARFETPSAIRKIADWNWGEFAGAYFLQTNGVTLSKLREWGIVSEKLDRAGLLETVDAKAAHDKEEAEQKKKREAAEKGLRALGVDPESIRRFGGDRAVLRAWELMESLDEDQRENLAKTYRERAAKHASDDMKNESFWRTEVKRQLDLQIAMREKTPELETIGRSELERIRPYITVDAPHEGEAWTDPQVVNHIVRYEPYSSFCALRVQDGRRFRNGMIVRVRPIAGGPAEYRRLRNVQRARGDHVELRLFPQLERDYEASTVEVSGLLPCPLNVNAAPREVLVAVLTGLQSRLFQTVSATGKTAPNIVTPTEAAAVADRLLQTTLRSHVELKVLLEKAASDGVIQRGDVEAILQSAVDPASPMLAHAGVPFVYTSGDVYEITATGIVNDEAANEVARVKTREIVQVSPPRDLVWILDGQEAFQDRVGGNGPLLDKNDPRSLQPAFIRGVWSNLLDTRPQDVFAMPWLFPQRQHLGGSSPPAEVKLVTWRDYVPQKVQKNPQGAWPPGVIFDEHYDQERDGHAFKNDVRLGPPQLPLRAWQTEDGQPRTFLGPGSIRAWFKIDKLNGSKLTCFFDSGVEDARDRITLGYDNETKELVATIRDESLDMTETGGKPRPSAELRHPCVLKPENWYHLAFAWKGGERGDLAMLLDGKPVGVEKTGTKTTGIIDASSLQIPVESTAGFPDRGFIRVGGFRHPDGILAGDTYTYRWSQPPWSTAQYYGEVLFYESKTATAFNIPALPNPWGAAWLARHRPQQGQPIPTPPAGSTDPTRVPQRGTGRYAEENDPGFTPLPVPRGFAHDIGTPVHPWGYTLWLKNGPNWVTRYVGNPGQPLPPKLPAYQETLRPGKAALLEALPENTPVTLVYKPNPAGWVKNDPLKQRPAVVQPTDNEVPVCWAGAFPDAGAITGGWPAQGFIRIGNERLFYTQIQQDPTDAGAKFIVQRGLDGTIAQAHYLWEPVVLESIRVTADADYARRNTLFEPEVLLQLTPPQSAATLAAALDPRTPCQVEWVSVLNAPQPYSPQTLILPVIRADRKPQNVATLLPDDTTPRFIPLQQQAGQPVDLPLRGDNRWVQAMIQLFNTANGRLPPNPGEANVVVLPPAVPAPGAPPPKPGAAPPLPGATKKLKEWLKAMEGNGSRAQKGTNVLPVWTPLTPQATSAGGGRAHQAGEKVLPTFVIGATHPNNARGTEFVGKGDLVTLACDADPSREERVVLWVTGTDAGHNEPAPVLPSLTGDPGTGAMIALDDFVQRNYLGASHARIVRFPSGQLPYGPSTMEIGAVGAKGAGTNQGGVSGRIDEIVMTQEPEPDQFELQVRSKGVQSALSNHPWPQSNTTNFFDVGSTTYETCLNPSKGLTQLLRGGMIVKLDDEIVAINEVDSGGTLGQSVRVVRGMLGTKSAPHGPEGSFWWNFPFPNVAVAEVGFVPPREDQMPIRPQKGQGLFHDDDFYVAIDRGKGEGPIELLPIKQQRKNVLMRPRDRFDRGTFRGSFGTAVAQPNPGPGEVLFDWPVRYLDRYQAGVSSLEGVFFQATKEAKGAYFQSITWDANLPNPFTKLLVAVRVDGEPSWDVKPASDKDVGVPGKLYVFDDPKKDNKILIRGDRIEVRVYMTYKGRAFAMDGWKQTPVLKRIQVTYRQPTRVKRREEMLE
ncbi:MAG: hypothetical protein ACAI25_19965, partial [Planctomycetota bacterium]